jgi:hypothetical protein
MNGKGRTVVVVSIDCSVVVVVVVVVVGGGEWVTKVIGK